MRHIELSEIIGEDVDVTSLPQDVVNIISDDFETIRVIKYPIEQTNGIIFCPALDWDMSDENITRDIINLKPVVSIGVFSGPSCDVYEKINYEMDAWIFYSCFDEAFLIKI